MLFKVIDNNSKFMEYISICVPDVNNIGLYINVNSLQKKYPILFADITYIETNYKNYNTTDIIADCYSNMYNLFTIKEIVSDNRATKIQAAKNVMYDGYISNYTHNISTNSITFTYTHTPTYPLNYIYLTTRGG